MTRRQPPRDRLDGYTPDASPGANLAQREDGFVNELTGAGDWLQDKTLGGVNGPMKFKVTFLTGMDVENRWRGSDLGAKIVETKPDEMTRAGYELIVQPEADEVESFADEVHDRADSIAAARAFITDTNAPRAPHKRTPLTRANIGQLADEMERHPGGVRAWLRDAFGAGAGTPPTDAPLPMAVPTIDDEGLAVTEALEKQWEELEVLQVFNEALKYEVAYGGSAVLVGLDDERAGLPPALAIDRKTARLLGGTDAGVRRGKRGYYLDAADDRNLTRPLDERSIEGVTHLTAFRGGWDGEVVAWRFYADARKANYGKPEIYMVRNEGVPLAGAPAPGEAPRAPQAAPPTIFFVHESRLLIFPGKAVSRRARVQMRGWGDSTFLRVDEVLSQFGQTWQGIAHLMTDWAQGVLTMEGLANMLAANKEGTPENKKFEGKILQRLRMIQMSKSLVRTMVLDAKEKFTREVTPMTGIADVLEQFAMRLAAAAGIPVAFLMGQRSGLNATGDADIRSFYDQILALIKLYVLPNLMKLTRFMMLAKTGPTGGRILKRWTIQPNPLWQPSGTELADQRLKTAQTDEIYYNIQALEAAEITASRFGGSKWSAETTIDLEGRAERAQLEAARLKAAPTPPSPPALQPGEPVPAEPGATPPALPAAPGAPKPPGAPPAIPPPAAPA